jgi:glycosyltransferase involved in cell wall biosynthesis
MPIQFLQPAAPDAIFKIAAQYDIGLATEVPHSENRRLCLTNKLFTYVLAGNCIVASDTPAQKKFLEEHPGIGVLYDRNDASSLSSQLEKLYHDRELLLNCRLRSNEFASEDLNWETEFGKLAVMIKNILYSDHPSEKEVTHVSAKSSVQQ